MSLWKNRYEYTRSKCWPVVPYRLTNYSEPDVKYALDYSIGLDKTLLKGWTVNLSECLKENNLTHLPVLVYEKKTVRCQKEGGGCDEYESTETKAYYDVLSPICDPLRKGNHAFHNMCQLQDRNVFDRIFGLYDDISSDKLIEADITDSIAIRNYGGHCPTAALIIYKKEHTTPENYKRIYFEYTCPRTKMKELVFPVQCEGITIALFIVGQIIDEPDVVKEAVEQAYKEYNQPPCKQSIVSTDGRTQILNIVLEQLRILENTYTQQLLGERRRILNKTLTELMDIMQFSSQNIANDNDVFINIHLSVINRANNHLKRKMGVSEIRIFWDEIDLTSYANKKGAAIKDFIKNRRAGVKWKWIESIGNVNDVLSINKMPEHLRNDVAIDKWSYFIFFPSLDDEPIIIGIKYHGKKRFLRKGHDKDTLFENFLLPNYALLLQNVQLRIQAQQKAITLDTHRARLSHEVGQIAFGIKSLASRFEKFTNSSFVVNPNQKGGYTSFDDTINTIKKRNILYQEDVLGQFQLIEMLLKVYGTDIVANARSFHLWQTFLNKWSFIFRTMSSLDLKTVEILPISSDRGSFADRHIQTDQVLLQGALYNIVNNAIKYSYFNTNIYIHFEKVYQPTEEYIFTITNYGAYLDPDDKTIYEKGVRCSNSKGVVNFNKNSFIEGEGFGLYWSKFLVEDKLGGNIHHSCREVCKYNVPLLEPFFTHYRDLDVFKIMWDKAVYQSLFDPQKTTQPDFDDIKDNYSHLCKTDKKNGWSEFDLIVNKKGEEALSDDRIANISLSRYCDDIDMKTYEVTFTIRVPKLEVTR